MCVGLPEQMSGQKCMYACAIVCVCVCMCIVACTQYRNEGWVREMRKYICLDINAFAWA